MIHESSVEVLGGFPAFPQEVVRLEASQGRTPVAEALGAGPIHRAFIEALPAAWRADPEVQVFSRLLYLKAGWFPLTPHWHLDWGGRSAPDGAPVQTLMVLLGEASRTEFVLGPLEHPAQERGRGGRWDEQVEAGLREGTLRRWHLEPETLVRFDSRSLHRARPATKAGWRLLLRAIRGLGRGEGAGGDPGRFTTCRNGFIPTTDEERARFEPYRDRGPA